MLIFSLWRAKLVLLPQALSIRWPRCAEIPQPHHLSEHLICQCEQDHPAKFINPQQLAQCCLREQVRLIKAVLSRGAAMHLIVTEKHRHKYQGTAILTLAASCFTSLYHPKGRGDLLLTSPCKYTSMHSVSTFGHIYSPSWAGETTQHPLSCCLKQGAFSDEDNPRWSPSSAFQSHPPASATRHTPTCNNLYFCPCWWQVFITERETVQTWTYSVANP